MTLIFQNKRLSTVAQMSQHYPAISVGGVRWWIFNAKTNGFKSCMRKVGRKILIDLGAFEEWLGKQGGKGNEKI